MNTDIYRIRETTRHSIFIVLTDLARDNKNQYCDDHAKKRAEMIENSLFNNCRKIDKENWFKTYTNIDIDKLVDSTEAITDKCIYR